MRRVVELLSILAVTLVSQLPSQTLQEQPAQTSPRLGISGGLGVGYVSATDVVDLVNASGGQTGRVSEFKAGAEFFGLVAIPLTGDWGLKLEYAYLICSYNPAVASSAAADFALAVHLPTVIGQYTLVDGGTYNVKAGAGMGYHFGSLTEKFLNLEDRYTAQGLGTVLDLEANTAFGTNFYGYLGANLRWDFVGKLTNEAGRSARLVSMSSDPTLEFFSIGARLGFTFYF